jgi:prolyl-tRNA synthetase
MILNQWANVVRWEKRTYMFMRTTEFLWQEGHTAHASHEDARDTEIWAMDAYESLFKNFIALPGYRGPKSRGETFAGAIETISYETLMPGGKALQGCTSHDLGQNFAKAFDIRFQNKKGEKEFAWQTSWGLTTRTIGALVLAHGDDNGLRLPPKLAPFQVVIIPVKLDDNIVKECLTLKETLQAEGIRVKFDDKDETLGFKINKWEMKGAPLRIEVGQKELESGEFKSVRRDNGEKISIHKTKIATEVKKILDEIQNNMFKEAEKFLKDNTREVDNYDDFKKIMENERGFLKVSWCEDSECEEKIKSETKATPRCKIEGLPAQAGEFKGKCVCCGRPSNSKWYFAQSY